MNAMKNERDPKESFKNYRARLKVVAGNVKRYLRGRMVHVSSEIVTLPAAGKDESADKGVLRGLYRDVTPPRLLQNGDFVRLARTKGKSFEYPKGRRFSRAAAVRLGKAFA